MIDRRNLLKLGALPGAAAFVPLERLTSAPVLLSAGSGQGDGDPGCFHGLEEI